MTMLPQPTPEEYKRLEDELANRALSDAEVDFIARGIDERKLTGPIFNIVKGLINRVREQAELATIQKPAITPTQETMMRNAIGRGHRNYFMAGLDNLADWQDLARKGFAWQSDNAVLLPACRGFNVTLKGLEYLEDRQRNDELNALRALVERFEQRVVIGGLSCDQDDDDSPDEHDFGGFGDEDTMLLPDDECSNCGIRRDVASLIADAHNRVDEYREKFAPVLIVLKELL